MFSKIVFPVLAILTSIACSTEKKLETRASEKLNGLYKYNYPTGEPYLEANYKDSLADGSTKIYYKNGNLFEHTQYRLGVKHGPSLKYHENGSMSSETMYDSGRMHGLQKKYRKDGTVAFEAPYWQDQPIKGLKEYYLSGQPVEFPTIIIKPVNHLLKDDSYTLELSMSNGTSNVVFYKGNLTDEKFIGKEAELLYTKNGVGKVFYFVGQRGFVMEKINVIAKVKTDLNNYYITTRPYTVSIEHY
jgi:antitoxin component YwqK of YwqJK toxin-antitoxin module